jgi:hypothetical protein
MWISNDRNVYTENSFRAPQFYDSQNTGYYVDPNGTSRFNVIQTNSVRNDGDVSSDDGFGMYWESSGSTAYAIYRESGSWSYRYPDLRIAFHTGIKFGANANYNGMRFYNDYTMATQVMSVNNATDPLGALNVYVNNSLQAGSSLRAPYFYDSNNTAYYMNPASVNDSRFEGVNDRTRAQLGNAATAYSSASAYMRRPNFTSDQRYWVGSMGWGRQDMNNVFNWGSGFIDSWSNPGNQPSGTSHWVGMQALHYTNGSTRYGWQMVGGPIDNLRFRNQWGSSPKAWRTIPVLDINNGNGGSMYAGRYYDSNNTSYYTDPASTSRMANLLINFLEFDNGFDIYDDNSSALSIRSANSDNGIIYFRDSNSTVCARLRWDDDTNNLELQSRDGERFLRGDRNSVTRLYYNNAEKFQTQSGGVYVTGYGRFTGDVVAYYSDMRLKDKEGDIENALDKVAKLNGFYYRNNKEANLIGYEGNDLQIGLSAQDVESVLPEIVKPAPLAQALGYDYKTVQYEKVVPLLVNAINEQKEIVETQKEEIEYLKSELSEMKEMMKQLLNKK